MTGNITLQDALDAGVGLLVHEDNDGKTGGFTVTAISGGANYVDGFPKTITLHIMHQPDGEHRTYTLADKQPEMPRAE